MEGDSDTWWKAVGNEPVRVANGIKNRVRATNTILFFRKREVPMGFKVTYSNFVCHYRQLKSELFRVRLTVGGDIL